MYAWSNAGDWPPRGPADAPQSNSDSHESRRARERRIRTENQPHRRFGRVVTRMAQKAANLLGRGQRGQ